ncbi:MAG: hypothetical protein JKY81_10220 [Colwellia sp.]|nr:hypothetical protein [Colwellia sp.]
MPLILDGKKYDKIKFDQGESSSLFILSSTDDGSEIVFDYLPKLDSSFNSDEYEVLLLENSFLNAENDVFTLYERYHNTTSDKCESKRVGWVFPITILESNESEHSNNTHLHGYQYVAFEHLLKAKTHINPTIDVRFNQSGKYSLSEIYGENTILAVIKKTRVPSPQQFTLQSYIPSLSQYGYFIKNEFELNHRVDQYKCSYLELRGKKRLYIRRSDVKLLENQYFNDLYTQYFKTISNPLLRFHLIYQVIEHIIGERFDKDFEEIIVKYQQNKIQKNDFIEEINELKKERTNIRKVFNIYKSNYNNSGNYLADLKRDCQDILEKHTEVKDDVGDLVYDVRNLLVHNFRKLSELEKEKLNQINMTFELVTSDFLIYGIEN